MSSAGVGASSGVQPLAAEQLEQRRWCQGVVRVLLASPVAGPRPLGCSAPLQQWPESSTTPFHPPLLPRQEKISQ